MALGERAGTGQRAGQPDSHRDRAARLQALGAGRVRIQCWKGQKFEAEVSNDLGAWTSLGVFTNETGTLEFTDPDAGQQAYRFYRAVSR